MSAGFFIGYEPRQPSRTARFVAVASGVLILVTLSLAATLSASQDEPAEATFEYGVVREYTGNVRSDPWPRLDLPDGSTMLLVGPFKHGADDAVAPYMGSRITVSGSLIQRGRLRMLEIVPGSIVEAGDVVDAAAGLAADASASPAPDARALSPVTVRGEIVDGKCWLGVMKPGDGTVHRACARLCLRGGIPAMLVFVDADGHRRTALITTGTDERIPYDFLRLVARPVELTGTYDPSAAGGTGLFTVDTRSIRVL